MKKLQHDYPKMRGGVKDRLDFSQKLIRFGSPTRPLATSLTLCKNLTNGVFGPPNADSHS